MNFNLKKTRPLLRLETSIVASKKACAFLQCVTISQRFIARL